MGQNTSLDCCTRGPGEEHQRGTHPHDALAPQPSTETLKKNLLASPTIRSQFKNHENLFTRLCAHRQDHILTNVEHMRSDELERFCDSLYDIDFEMMDMMYNHLILHPQKLDSKPDSIDPIRNKTRLSDISNEENLKLRRQGLELIQGGKVAVLLMSGGEGTQLASGHPKGLFNIGMPSGKSIFEYFANKITRVCQLACEAFDTPYKKPSIMWYILTNEANNEEITGHFAQHNYFGLGSTNIMFFTQQSLPTLDFYGKIIMESKNKIYMAPNGTGGLFHALARHGIFKDMKERGIKFVHLLGVDNVLAKPADPLFMGFANSRNCDIACKFVAKTHPGDKSNVFALRNGKPHVVEYTELTQEQINQRDRQGNLAYDAIDIMNVVYSINFLEHLVVSGKKELVKNYHIVKKKIKYYDKTLRETVTPLDNNGYKFELFNFDAFLLTRPENFGLLEARKEEEVAILKNAANSLEDSPEKVREQVALLHQRWLESKGVSFDRRAGGVQDSLFELDCERFYDEFDPRLDQIANKYKRMTIRLPCYLQD